MEVGVDDRVRGRGRRPGWRRSRRCDAAWTRRWRRRPRRPGGRTPCTACSAPRGPGPDRRGRRPGRRVAPPRAGWDSPWRTSSSSVDSGRGREAVLAVGAGLGHGGRHVEGDRSAWIVRAHRVDRSASATLEVPRGRHPQDRFRSRRSASSTSDPRRSCPKRPRRPGATRRPSWRGAKAARDVLDQRVSASREARPEGRAAQALQQAKKADGAKRKRAPRSAKRSRRSRARGVSGPRRGAGQGAQPPGPEGGGQGGQAGRGGGGQGPEVRLASRAAGPKKKLDEVTEAATGLVSDRS